MHKLSLLLLCLLLTAIGSSQSISGTVISPSGDPLDGATTIALSAVDSSMAGFALTDARGRYQITDLAKGDYLVQYSYLGYRDTTVMVSMSGKDQSLDELRMVESGIDLEAIMIQAEHVPIRMTNDTIEYNARAFDVSPNADVEELLRKMPGIEVAKDGSIKAQGEKVQKVLVEGKEFFGNDPKIATKNLPADAVETVQVFDKKSDMAEWSGIDDGNEAKTINLELKEDRKTGIFGNGSIGGGTEERWKAKGNVNRFAPAYQMSILGAANNVNEQAFSFGDYIDLMGGLGNAMSGGQIELNGNDMDYNTAQGFTDVYSIGANFNSDLSDRTELTSSYFYSRADKDLDRQQFTQSLLQTQDYTSDERTRIDRIGNRHRINASIKSDIDSSSMLRVRASLSLEDKDLASELSRTLYKPQDSPQNQTSTTNQNDSDRFSYNLRANYNRKLAKKGRILSLQAEWSDSDQDDQRLLRSENLFYKNNLTDTIRQRQVVDDGESQYMVKASYTEPLGRRQYLDLSYSHQNYNESYDKTFYNQLGSRDIIDELLSDSYRRDYSYHRAGMQYKRNRNDYKLNLGLNVQRATLTGKVGREAEDQTQRYLHLLPYANYSLDFSRNSGASIRYNTSMTPPSMRQLRPLASNEDPLFVYQGNPDLEASYRHQLGINYHSYSAFSNVSFFANANVSYTQNNIINAQSIDKNFRQMITPINVDDSYRASGYASFGSPLRPVGMKMNLSYNASWSRTPYYLNGTEDRVSRNDHQLQLTLENRKKKVLDWLVGANIGYNHLAYRSGSRDAQSYYRQNFFADVSKDFNHGWRISTTMDYQIYSADVTGSSTGLPIWNAKISKTFLKGQRGLLTLSISDILNNNLGISRFNDLNFVVEERVVTLQRYAMLTFGYKFAGFGAKKNGGIEIMGGGIR